MTSERTPLILGACGLAVALTIIGFALLPDQTNGAKLVPNKGIEAPKARDARWDKWASSSTSADSKVTTTALCSTKIENVYPVLQAYKDGDLTALLGLKARGLAIKLEKDTNIDVISEENGVRLVLVKSGFQSGETCWLWKGFMN